jgi:hypothetical protein
MTHISEQFLRRRAHTPMRSLADLLGIEDIYAQIHRQFSYILKSSARRRIEKVTKGRRAGPLYIQMVSNPFFLLTIEARTFGV